MGSVKEYTVFEIVENISDCREVGLMNCTIVKTKKVISTESALQSECDTFNFFNKTNLVFRLTANQGDTMTEKTRHFVVFYTVTNDQGRVFNGDTTTSGSEFVNCEFIRHQITCSLGDEYGVLTVILTGILELSPEDFKTYTRKEN